MEFHRVLLLLIPTLYMIVPLLIESWQKFSPPWHTPYSIWLAALVLAFLLEKRRKDV